MNALHIGIVSQKRKETSLKQLEFLKFQLIKGIPTEIISNKITMKVIQLYTLIIKINSQQSSKKYIDKKEVVLS